MELVEQVRFEVGDEEGPDELFTVEQVEHKLNERGGNVIAAAADLCDILATRFAKEFDFSSQARMQFRKSQKAEAYERRAKALRLRVGGLTVVEMTRSDGFSDDVSVREGAGESHRSGRVRQGYTDPDIPF